MRSHVDAGWLISCRYKVCLYGIDANTPEEQNATFAEFIFFRQGNIIVGKEADYLLQETRARNEDTPREILDIVGKDFIVTVVQDDNTFNSNHYHFQVKSTEYVTNAELLAPLPLHNVTHPDPAGQPYSSTMVPSSTAQTSSPGTPPSAESAPGTNEKLLSHDHEALTTPPAIEFTARENENLLPQEQEHEASYHRGRTRREKKVQCW